MIEIARSFSPDTVSERIRKFRKEVSKSQMAFLDEYGDKIKAARSTLSEWETGKSLPDVWQLLELCNIFDCDTGYLLGEYDCKRRVASDIKAETGLEETAISRLRMINLLASERSVLISNLLSNPLFSAFIDCLEESIKLAREVEYRDRDEKKLTEILSEKGYDGYDTKAFLHEYHATRNDEIASNHKIKEIALSPDDTERFYFLSAIEYLKEAATDVRKKVLRKQEGGI